MNILLWIVQAVLAFAFVMAGAIKLQKTAAQLKIRGKGRMDWVDDVSASQLRMIGGLELAGGVGIILPLATGILPWLTSLAAIGLALTMAGAMALHAKRKDPPAAFGVTGALLAMALFVAWGRYGA